MSLSLITFNFKTTPLGLREKLAVPVGAMASLLSEARERCSLDEVMMVSTCNRVEFYYVAPDGPAASRCLLEWMKRGFAGWDDELERSAVVLHGEPALIHLFRVACSLESMVIGEPQILGQVKEGYQVASEHQALGPYLNGLMQRVFHTAKRVRTETSIARNPVSVSYVASELAARIFETLADKAVLVVGAGEMAELVVTHLQKAGVRRLLITNRTFANAVALAEKFQGSAVRFEHLAGHLAEADIVISSTGAQGYVIDAEMVRQAERARKGRPMFLIDIAVPRDVDPQVDQISNVYCYDVDDLQQVAESNKSEREQEALAAQRIVEDEVARFVRWKHSDAVKPVLKALRQHFADTGQQELEKLLGRLKHLPESDAQALRGLVQSLVNKLLHQPSTRLRTMGEDLNGQMYAQALQELFGLAPDAAGHEERPPAPGAAPAAAQDAARPVERNVLPFRAAGPSST
jgi:glutamyl-tRNA reductase